MNKAYFLAQSQEICRNPGKLLYKMNYHTLRFVLKKLLVETNEYGFIQKLTALDMNQFNRYEKELRKHADIFETIRTRYNSVRDSNPPYQTWHKVIYLLVRAYKPDIMFETGVFEGLSSIHILLAMEDNKKGKLVSFDVPPKEAIDNSTHIMKFKKLPKNHESGWTIPVHLKKRWELHIGNTKKTLPNILEKYKKIDIFMHDSLHTYKHMMMEYKLAWPHIKKGGLLLSDDVYFTKAFKTFRKIKKRNKLIVYGFGGLIK